MTHSGTSYVLNDPFMWLNGLNESLRWLDVLNESFSTLGEVEGQSVKRATHSMWWVMGKASKERSAARR